MVALRLTVLLAALADMAVVVTEVATATLPPLDHLPGGKYSWSPTRPPRSSPSSIHTCLYTDTIGSARGLKSCPLEIGFVVMT